MERQTSLSDYPAGELRPSRRVLTVQTHAAPIGSAEEWRLGHTEAYRCFGRIFFHGDIDHCGEAAIFWNACRMKKHMDRHDFRYAMKNYDDKPVFSNTIPKNVEKTRQEIYRHKLYAFDEDGQIVEAEVPDSVLKAVHMKH